MRYTLLIILLVSLLPKPGIAQDHLKDNQYHYRFYNGLNIYLMEDKGDPQITVGITFRHGIFAEPDSLHGLSYQFHKAYSKSLAAWAKERNITYRDSFAVDRTVHIFQFSPSILEKTLGELSIKLSAPAIVHPSDLVSTIPIPQPNSNLPTNFVEHGKKLLWDKYYLRSTLSADSLPMDTAMVQKVHNTYYCPSNAVVLIRGNFVNREVYPMVQMSLASWKDCAHNPFFENPVPYPKDFHFSSQFVSEDSAISQPVIVLWLRGPASIQDKEYFLWAALVEETFKNATMTKAFMDSSHILDLKLSFDSKRYASTVMVTMQPDTIRPDSAYMNLFRFFKFAGEGKIFNVDDVEKSKLTLLKNFEKAEKDPIGQINTFANYWLNAEVDDYSLMAVKMEAVTVEQLREFVHKYIQNQPFVAGLLINKENRATLKTDTFFTPTFPIEKYKVFFTKNNAFIPDSIHDSVIRSLAQAIKMNPSIKVVISGVAAKNELSYINDDAMVEFLKQHPGFTLTPDNLIPTKKIRLDIYRSLKVVKALIELGVEERQLSGTGKMVEPGMMNPEPDQQTYCTITIY